MNVDEEIDFLNHYLLKLCPECVMRQDKLTYRKYKFVMCANE